MQTADVIVVGGGAMGWSTAFWLTRSDPRLRVMVCEADPTHSRAATALSVASIRQQFTTPINVKISRFGLAFLRNFEAETGGPNLALRENGYLLLAGTEDGSTVLRTAAAMQRAEGACTELLSPTALAARFPWLRTDGIALGALGASGEGWFDNMGFLAGLRAAALARGAQERRQAVTDVLREGPRAVGVRLADGSAISAGAVVLAAGTSTPGLLEALGEKCPVELRKRTVFVLSVPEAQHPDAPLLVDPTGFYLRPEGGFWIAGLVPAEDGPCDPDDFAPDHALFEDHLWPRLHARSTDFAAVKVLRAWAGHYDFNVLDQNALAGLWPGWENLYALTGFSGHGLQQAPAMGRGMAEHVTTGRYQTLDLGELTPERLATGRLVQEHAII